MRLRLCIEPMHILEIAALNGFFVGEYFHFTGTQIDMWIVSQVIQLLFYALWMSQVIGIHASNPVALCRIDSGIQCCDNTGCRAL